MKIAVLSTGAGHVRRGIETWAVSLAEALSGRRGVDVNLLAGGPISNIGKVANGSRVPCLNRVFVPCLRRSSATNRLITSLCSRAGGWRYGFGSTYQTEQTTFALSMWHQGLMDYDVFHLQDPWLAWLLERQVRSGKCKGHVILAHGTEEDMKFLEPFRNVQELSPSYFAHHVKPWPEGKRRWMIPNFVDTGQFHQVPKGDCRQQLGLPAEAFVVLSVGAINLCRKRVDWLIGEFERMTCDKAVLVIAGTAEDVEGRQILADARRRLGGRLVVMENVRHVDMPQIYGAADVFALCSLSEIFGIAFIEAMSCGVPCIGHASGVTPWVIGDGGSCVDMREREALASELARYLNPELRKARGNLARTHAESTFGKDTVVDQIVKMYEEVLQT